MPNGNSKPLTAPLINHDELRRHGFFYAGPDTHQQPVNRQNQPEFGHKNSRRDRKSPSIQPKETTMTTQAQQHAKKSTPNLGNGNGDDGLSASEIASAVDSALQHSLPMLIGKALNDSVKTVEQSLATHVSPLGEAIGKTINPTLTSINASFSGVQEAFRANSEAFTKNSAALTQVTGNLDTIVLGVHSAKEAAEESMRASARAEEAAKAVVKDLNKVSMTNIWGDLRQVGVTGIVAGIVGIAAWGFGAMFGASSEPAASAPVRRAA